KLIRGLESLTQLRWLELSAGTLTRDLVTQVLGLPHLVRLNLYLMAFEAGAIPALTKEPALRILTVTISHNQNLPAELVRLEQLRFSGGGCNDLPQSELLSLQMALPACRIVHGWSDRDEYDYDWS